MDCTIKQTNNYFIFTSHNLLPGLMFWTDSAAVVLFGCYGQQKQTT